MDVDTFQEGFYELCCSQPPGGFTDFLTQSLKKKKMLLLFDADIKQDPKIKHLDLMGSCCLQRQLQAFIKMMSVGNEIEKGLGEPAAQWTSH